MLTMVKLVALLMMVLSIAASVSAALDRINPCYNYGTGLLTYVSKELDEQKFVYTPAECQTFCIIKVGPSCRAWQLRVNSPDENKADSECKVVTGEGDLKPISNEDYVSGPAQCENMDYYDNACVLRDYKRETNWPIEGDSVIKNVKSYASCMLKCRDKFDDGCVNYTFDAKDEICILLRGGKVVVAVGSFTGKGHCDECEDVGRDYSGYEIDDGRKRKVQNSFRDCKAYCAATKGCIVVVFLPSKFKSFAAGMCFPKYGAGKWDPNANCISAAMECKREPWNQCFDFGVYYVSKGWSKKVMAVSATECRKKCRSHGDACNFFSFHADILERATEDVPEGSDVGTCWLFGNMKGHVTEGYGLAFISGEKICSKVGIFEDNKSTYEGFVFESWGAASTEETEAETLKICQEECNGHKYCYFFNFKDKKCDMMSDAKLVVAAEDGYIVGWKAYNIKKLTDHNLSEPCELTFEMYPSTGYKIYTQVGFPECWRMCDQSNKCGSINFDESSGSCALLSGRFAPKTESKTIISATKCG